MASRLDKRKCVKFPEAYLTLKEVAEMVNVRRSAFYENNHQLLDDYIASGLLIGRPRKNSPDMYLMSSVVKLMKDASDYGCAIEELYKKRKGRKAVMK